MCHRAHLVAVAAGLVMTAGSAAFAIDHHITLNNNWNGMVQPGEGADPDDVTGFRAISDRACYVDAGNANALGSNPIVGSSGLTYTVETNAGVFDIVHLGNTATAIAGGTCPGCPTRFWDDVDDVDNRGVQPTWFPGPANAHTLPQTTDVSGLGLTLDVNSTVGLLYHVSNGGGNFQVVLAFTDTTSVTVTCTANDWFGATNPPAPGPGVSAQTRLGGTTFAGTGNRDLPSFPAWPTESLSVTEATITPTSLANAGLGNVVGKTLASITFQNINQPNRGYAIFGATVTTGVPGPSNDDCAAPIDIVLGSNAGNSSTALGSSTSPCGSSDTADAWYRYVAASTGTLEARICGASFNTTLAVYTSCGAAAVACNDNGCFLGSRVSWAATSGQTYLIRVAGNNGTRGSFNLELVADPATHTDTTIPLAYNWNGMAHTGEIGVPDAPAGFRSISDRALHASGTTGALNAGFTHGTNFLPYSVAGAAGALDIVHIGATGPGTPHAWDCSPDADTNGIQPTWLTNIDQSGPQRTNLNPLNRAMGANTQIGVIFQMSNGGGFFECTLEFGDGTNATVQLAAADWFGAQNPPPASPGVETQDLLGTFAATDNQDSAALGAVALNVVEATFSTTSLINAGLGDHTGKRLVGMTFQNSSSPITAGIAIFAATLRDAVADASSAGPAGVGSAVPATVETTRSVRLTVAAAPGQNPTSTGLGVTVDLQPFGGSATQSMFDNGTNGDVTAGDSIYSYALTIPASQGAGGYTPQFTVSDAQARSATGNISFSVAAYAWNENLDGGGDAGDLPGTALTPPGSGALNALGGTLCDNDVDMYRIEICDVASFSASTVGGTNGDTQLFLFRADGTGVAYNDDSTGLQSTITNLNVTTPGDYLLAVGIWDRDPVDAGALVLWNDAGGEPAPDGPGAANPVAGWTGATAAAGDYRVTLTGVCFFNPCGSADFDGDGDTGTDADIEAFFACLGGNCCATCGTADFDGDGDTGTDADIEAFFRVLGGGTC